MKLQRKKLTKDTRPHVGKVVEIKWGTSKGRDTYGYTTAALYYDGRKVAACNGGGYDMRGTVVGDWITDTMTPALLKLKPEVMPEHSHWQPERARYCAGKCREAAIEARARKDGTAEELPKLAEDCWECPHCGGETYPSRDGKTVKDGRYFYGLTFHDPHFNPAKAVVGKDCSDRTLAKDGSNGQTVAEAEAAGVSFGLERYQAIYSASSKFPTRRHRVPSIDGACGLSSVETILRAVGLALKRLDRNEHRSSGPELYEVVRA